MLTVGKGPSGAVCCGELSSIVVFLAGPSILPPEAAARKRRSGARALDLGNSIVPRRLNLHPRQKSAINAGFPLSRGQPLPGLLAGRAARVSPRVGARVRGERQIQSEARKESKGRS